MRRKGGLGGRTALLVAGLLFLTGVAAQAAITEYVPDASTAVLYHLNEDTAPPADRVVTDASGNVHLGTDLAWPFDGVNGPNGLSTAMTSGTQWKRAFRFGDADTTVFSESRFTVEAWVRDPGTVGSIHTDVNTIFRVFSGGDIQFAVETIDSEKKLRLNYNDTTVDGTKLYSNAVTFDSEAWYHAAVTYDDNGASTPDNSTVTFYFTPEADFNSGVTQVGQATGAKDLEELGMTGGVLIGEEFDFGGPEDPSNNFNGYLDEVRYSNVVRFGGVVPDPVGLELIGMVLLALRKGRA